MFTIIVAIGRNGEIGYNGNLIWRIPEDMKFFKETTINHKVVMGRKTFLSIPNGKLKDRENVVVSNSMDSCKDITVINDFNQYLKENYNSEEEIFIIGGESIYTTALPYVSKMYITHIDEECNNADTFFPPFAQYDFKKQNIGIFEYNKIKYIRVEYTKK